ncbi:hypothetical protein C6T58_10920 [Burkholderia multivorans]|nr:hypothetical protein C6T58_10920 [Burkholderia multivorans]
MEFELAGHNVASQSITVAAPRMLVRVAQAWSASIPLIPRVSRHGTVRARRAWLAHMLTPPD